MLWTSVANNTGQDSIAILDAYTFEQLSAYKHNATLFIDKDTFIKVLDQTTYQLVGGRQRIETGTLCGDRYHLKLLEWQIVDSKIYSIHIKFEAWNQQYKIDIEYKALVNNDNPGGRGLGLKVFEQISHYEAVLYGKREEN
ncbi:unnamed protein product [Rotaria sp. Silwood1]|nr:unnamed protein product [Rotaria sp. Silwood1]CAF1609684.1 unnamed protein product [Rotaria sp. Silwood1]CAF3696987.1 unnamed protein product [Rotaria sp. Silwood1]CAF3701996.1 unnamed protein product [Rotaria sp. Silwood1]CAF3702119.1 unnamed protein product [Rotaria sp. Silwood1]